MAETVVTAPGATTGTAGGTPAPTGGQKFTAELLGTFVLVFFGVGTAIATGGEVVTTGLAFGLTVLVMAYALGRISGGHFNPAVTLGAVVGGRLSWTQAGLYVAAQLVGGLLGGAVLWLIYQAFPGFTSTGHFGQNAYGMGGVAWWGALLVEVVTTAVFLVVILAVTDERNEHPSLAPLAIGLSLSMIHFATINITGTSVNPARSIGANLFAGSEAVKQLWLFIVAPLLGGTLGGVLYPALFGRASEPVAGSGLRLPRRTPPGAVPGYGAPDAYQQQWNQQFGQQAGQPGYPGYPPQQAPPQPYQQAPRHAQQPWPPQPAHWQHPQAPQPWPGNDDDSGQTQVRPPT